jgi:hypothetical protein
VDFVGEEDVTKGRIPGTHREGKGYRGERFMTGLCIRSTSAGDIGFRC